MKSPSIFRSNRISDRLVAAGLTLAALVLYSWTLAPTVLEADAGEFQFVPWLPGIAHPTGYPLYVLLGWLWTHLLPIGEVAWRMNLLSAVFAALTVGFTYTAARQLMAATLPQVPPAARTAAAALTAAAFAVTLTFWSLAVVAEVYALHALFVAAILWLALKFRASQGRARQTTGKWLALTVGLSLTHHRTSILLLPALALFLYLQHKKQQVPMNPSPAQALTYLGLLAAPLLLYLYLPLVAPYTPYATITLSKEQTLVLYENSARGFLNHVLATVFTGDLRPAGAAAAIPDRLGLTWRLMRQQVGWIGAGLAAIGLLVLWRRRSYDLLLLTGLSFVSFVAFNLVYFIGDIFVLYIPAWLILTLWMGLAIPASAWKLADFVAMQKTSHSPLPVFEGINQKVSSLLYQGLQILGLMFFAGFVLVLLATRGGEIQQRFSATPALRWQTILSGPIPTGAVLLSNDRNEMMPMWYYQYVDQRRPDLIGLFPLITPEPEYATIGGVLDQALASGRPVYLIKPMDGLSLKADLYPEGALFRAEAATLAPDTIINENLPPVAVAQADGRAVTETIRLLGYSVTPTTAAPGDLVTVTLYWQPVGPLTVDYTSFVHLVNEQGQGVAQSDHRPGDIYYPSHYWRVGEVLRDRHTLTVPVNARPGRYRWRVGMYFQPQPGQIQAMGEGLLIGSLTVQ